MIPASVVNERIKKWNGAGVLRFTDTIEGEVRISAGNSGFFEFSKIIGGLVVGGYNRPGHRTGFLDKSNLEKITHSGTGAERFGRRILSLSGQGEKVPVVMGVHVKASVQGMVYGKNIVNSSFDLNINGKDMNRSHAGLFVECLGIRVTGFLRDIGIADIKTVGQGYGIELQSCAYSTIHDLSGYGARYLASVSDSGIGNTIQRISGSGLVCLVDTHGGTEKDLTISDVDGTVRIGNGAWSGKPDNPTISRCKEVIDVLPMVWK